MSVSELKTHRKTYSRTHNSLRKNNVPLKKSINQNIAILSVKELLNANTVIDSIQVYTKFLMSNCNSTVLRLQFDKSFWVKVVYSSCSVLFWVLMTFQVNSRFSKSICDGMVIVLMFMIIKSVYLLHWFEWTVLWFKEFGRKQLWNRFETISRL